MDNTEYDPAFIRALTHPRKGVGEVTLQRLGVFASGQDSSLWEALPSFLLSTELPTVQREALEGFRNFILRMLARSSVAVNRPPLFYIAWSVPLSMSTTYLIAMM